MAFGFPGNSSAKGLLVSIDQGKLLRDYVHNLRLTNKIVPPELILDHSKYDINKELLL